MTRRSTAYADIVAGLVDAREDMTTERFDREIASALQAGRLDEELARTLRWWQRESVRAVRDHLIEVLPPVLESLEAQATRLGTADQPTPDLQAPADNNIGPTSSEPDRTAARTVELTVDTQGPPRQRADHRRRVLVASLVEASGSATGMRNEGGGRRR